MRLKDTKGLQYLAHLLRHPGQEFLALDLLSEGSRVPGAAGGADSDLGPLLDPEAKRAYRARLQELREELDEANGFNDLGRVAQLQAEMDFLSQQLSAAAGLGGRDRKAGAAAERARLMVTKRIKGTFKTISDTHPRLAHHLRACVKTGYVCVYAPPPDEPVAWQL